jgi:hypothetical protein
MPWTRAQTDIETALYGLPVEITSDRWQVRIDIHDVDPAEVQGRLHEMFRALSNFVKRCDYGGGCNATLHFMTSEKVDGTPTKIPVRSIRTADGLAFIIRNHFKDCPGLTPRQAQGAPRSAPTTPKADESKGGPAKPQGAPLKQASLFDMPGEYPN